MKTDSKYRQWAFIIRRGFLAVSTRPAVLLVLMGGIFLYGLLYNYMYAPNKVTDMPVAVVDCSAATISAGWRLRRKWRCTAWPAISARHGNG